MWPPSFYVCRTHLLLFFSFLLLCSLSKVRFVFFFAFIFVVFFKYICKVHQTQETSQTHKNRHTESFHKQNVMNVFLLLLIFFLFVCLPIFTIVKAMGFVNLSVCVWSRNFSSFIRLNCFSSYPLVVCSKI